MTQTLMDFLSLVTPPPAATSGACDKPPPRQSVLGRAKQHYLERLARLNRKVGNLAKGGHLIGVPLCPSACEPGPLADFALSLGTDPYRRWNMVLYANNEATARVLRTVPYHASYDGAVDSVMVDFLNGLRAKRDLQRKATPNLTAVGLARLNRRFRDRLHADCSRIEDALFGAQERQWRLYSDTETDAASPPKALINPAISAGSGAENRIC